MPDAGGGQRLHDQVRAGPGHAGLTDPAARGHRPYHLDLPLPHPVDLVHHVGDHAAVVGDHVDHLAHLRPLRAPGEVHHRVLLGEVGYLRLRVLHDVTVALHVVEIRGEHFAPRVEDAAVGGRPAHHGRAHLHRALLPRGGAGRHHHRVVVDAGARAMLGQHREAVHRGEGRRAPAGDHRHRDARLLEQGERPLEEFAGIGIAIGEGHQSLELQARERHRGASQREGLVRRLHTGALEAGVALDEELEVHVVARGGRRELAGHHLVVEHHREPPHPPREGGQPLGLGRAEDVVRQQHVVGHLGVGEDLHLAQLLAGDADRARRHLHLTDGRDLVRLDMRSVAEPVPGQVRLHAADVVRHHVQVDRHGGRLERGDRGHGSLLSLRFHSSHGRATVPATDASARFASSGLR